MLKGGGILGTFMEVNTSDCLYIHAQYYTVTGQYSKTVYLEDRRGCTELPDTRLFADMHVCTAIHIRRSLRL